MTKPNRVPAEPEGQQADPEFEELRRLFNEGLASGFEPYEGIESIKAELRLRHKKR